MKACRVPGNRQVPAPVEGKMPSVAAAHADPQARMREHLICQTVILLLCPALLV
jgi:hypothetical protein